jgi:GNAT superfamily N-acetyltransferase
VISGVADLHVHGAPSLVPRHGFDHEVLGAHGAVGVDFAVLKAHEGSTAERAVLAAQRGEAAGVQVVGGIVLNSPAGGANPDGVEVAARLGARVVWMPTISAPAHVASAANPELAVHQGLAFRQVDVLDDAGRLLPGWHDVLDVVAAHDLVLASGHLRCAEALVLFRAARAAGVGRMLLNHPKMPFLHWDDDAVPELRELGVVLELGILPDLLTDGPGSVTLGAVYPAELLAFGGDLGHAAHPTMAQALPGWLADLERTVGTSDAELIMTTVGRRLVQR